MWVWGGFWRMEELVSGWVTCSEALSAEAQLGLQALTFALEFKQRSLYWLYWQCQGHCWMCPAPGPCPPPVPLPPCFGQCLSQGGIWRQGTRVYSALCEMSARGCKQCVVLLRESTELHWQHFSMGNGKGWKPPGMEGWAAGSCSCGRKVSVWSTCNK